MLAGLGLTIYYMGVNAAPIRSAMGLSGTGLWFGIQPVSAGVFGVFAGVVVTVLVSLLPRPQALSMDGSSRIASDGI
jgi:cation/acetate symporter